MDRTVNKAKNFEEPHAWDVHQNIQMTPNERMLVASELKKRAYPEPNMDVREWHRQKYRSLMNSTVSPQRSRERRSIVRPRVRKVLTQTSKEMELFIDDPPTFGTAPPRF